MTLLLVIAIAAVIAIAIIAYTEDRQHAAFCDELVNSIPLVDNSADVRARFAHIGPDDVISAAIDAYINR